MSVPEKSVPVVDVKSLNGPMPASWLSRNFKLTCPICHHQEWVPGSKFGDGNALVPGSPFTELECVLPCKCCKRVPMYKIKVVLSEPVVEVETESMAQAAKSEFPPEDFLMPATTHAKIPRNQLGFGPKESK